MDNTDFVSPLLDRYTEITREVEQIDSKLNVGQKLFDTTLNLAIEAAGPEPLELQAQMDKRIEVADALEKVAIIEVLRRIAKNNEALVKTWYEANKPKEEPKPNEQEQEAFRAERKKVVDMGQAVYNLIAQIAPDKAETLNKLSHLRGGFGGKGVLRGKRIKGVIDYTVEGHKVDGHKMGDVKAKLEDLGVKVSAKDIKDELDKQVEGFDYENPPTNFSWSVGGKFIKASKVSAADEGDDTDEGDDDEDVTTEEISAPEGADTL